MVQSLYTLIFVIVGITLIHFVIKRETFDFWLGCAAIGLLYFIVDWAIEVLPVTYYIGFDYPLFFGAVVIIASVKMVTIARDKLQKGSLSGES